MQIYIYSCGVCDHEILFLLSVLQSFTLLLSFFIGAFMLTAKYLDSIGPMGVGIRNASRLNHLYAVHPFMHCASFWKPYVEYTETPQSI